MDHPFRSAALGGFNKQDVLDYLEKMASENGQRQQELQQRLTQAEEERDRLSAQAAELEERLSIVNRDREAMTQELEHAKAALEASHDREAAQEAQLTQLRQERDQLREETQRLAPDAAAYSAVKERTAGVELEAHRRAQEVQEQARQEARQLRRQMEQWMRRVGEEYDALRTQIDATVSHAADRLDKANQCLTQITSLLADQDVALEELSRAYDSTDQEKVPAPQPLHD